MNLYCPNLENHNDGHTDTDKSEKCHYCKGKGHILTKFEHVTYVTEINRMKVLVLPGYIECKVCRGYGYHG